MLSALISFLGGSAFRMIWGEVSSYFNKRQDHRHEVERLRIEAAIDRERHARDCERIRLQADLNVREVQVQADAKINQIEADAWLEAVRGVNKQTGVGWVDAWNGTIRPLLATLSIGVVVAGVIANGWTLTDWDRELVAAILGIYVADRSLAKRGK